MYKDTDDEIWKDIEGLEELYAVSTKGRVKNIKTGRILAGCYNNSGYKCIALKGKTYLIHRLIALAFIPNPDNLPQVDHVDENKRNNDISNLRWVSAADNIRHSIYKQCCKIKQLDKNGNLIKIWNSVHQIGRELGYDMSTIVKVCKCKQRSAFGYHWQYLDSSSQRVMNRALVAYKGDEYVGTFTNAVKASEELGLNYGSINLYLQGRLASLKGYTFKYVE